MPAHQFDVSSHPCRGSQPAPAVGSEPGRRRAGSPAVGDGHHLLGLQGSHGNRHVQRVVGACVQPKLVVGAAGDRCEREADRAARDVMRGRAVRVSAASPATVARQPVEPTGDRTEASTEGGPHAAITRARGGGRPLPDGLRVPMEQAFGADFRDVRVHVDERADQASRSLHAHALTAGRDIFFRRGDYAPSTAAGRELLAHELTHVVQQDRGSARLVQRKVGFEFEAQWNVRDVSGATVKADYDTAVSAYEDDVRVKLLRRMLEVDRNSYLPAGHPLRLDDRERSRVSRLGDEWIAGDRPTRAGRRKLTAVGLTPGSTTWNEAVMSLLINSQVAERPLLGANLSKGRTTEGIVVYGTGFDLTADASPTGGSNLEWVTDPLETRDEVVRVIADVARMVRYLNGRKDDESIPSEDVTAGGGRPRPGLRIYPLNRQELLFAPQVTGGLRIDRLPKLVDFLARSKGAGARAKSELFLDLDPVRLSLDAARAAVRTDRRLARMDTKALLGLLAVVGSYLRNGAAMPDQANSKSIAGGLMARTDFAFTFSLLPPKVQAYVSEPPAGAAMPRFVSLALASGGMTESAADERLFQHTVERGLAGKREETTVPLTRRQWLEGITTGSDLLRNWKRLSPEDKEAHAGHEQEWTAIHGSLAALGDTRELVGKSNARVAALIVELRRMRDRLTVDDLERIALDTFELVERLNLGKTLRYGGGG